MISYSFSSKLRLIAPVINLRFNIILTAFLFLFQISNGQHPDLINPTQIDNRYIALLVKQEYNNLRKLNRLNILTQNNILEAHANELVKQHLQNKKDKYGLIKHNTIVHQLEAQGLQTQRLEGFYVSTYLEECINYFSPIEAYTYRNQSYKQTARNIVQIVKSSPSYLTLIRDNSFTDIGVGVSFDSTNNQLMVLQIFASGENISHEIESSELSDTGSTFGYKQKVWFKRARNRNRNLRLAQAWTSSNSGYTGWVSTKRKTIRRSFPWYHFRSGLVLETYSSSDFEDESKLISTPCRNNQQSIINGITSKRITRKEIMAMWKTQTKPKYVKIFKWETPLKKWPRIISLKLPYSEDLYSSSQLLVIRKGKLCNILQINPCPTKELSVSFPKIPFLLLDIVKKPDTTLLYRPDSSTYQIYYERGVTTLSEDDQQGLLDLVPEGSQITKIKIRAFASIEGNLSRNEELFTQRAATIKDFIEQNNLAVSDVQVDLTTLENWNMMIQQMNADSVYFTFAQKSKFEIRDYINTHLSDSIITVWLNEQRFAYVSFDLTKTEKKPETADDVLSIFNTVVAQRKYTTSVVNRLVNLQKRYYGLLAGMQQANTNLLQFPDDNRLLQLKYNEAIFRYQYQGGSEEELHNIVESITRQKGVNRTLRTQCIQQHLIYLANIFFYHRSRSPQYADWNCPSEKNETLFFIKPKKHKHQYSPLPPSIEALDILPILAKSYSQQSEYRDLVNSLYLYYYVNRAQLLLQEKKFEYLYQVKRLASVVWNRYVVSHTLTDEETLNFALFFNLTHQKSYAIKLLEPMVKRQHPKALMVWISLNYNVNNERSTEDALLQAQKVLSKQQWLELVESGTYLPLTLLERYKVRHSWDEYKNMSY